MALRPEEVDSSQGDAQLKAQEKKGLFLGIGHGALGVGEAQDVQHGLMGIALPKRLPQGLTLFGVTAVTRVTGERFPHLVAGGIIDQVDGVIHADYPLEDYFKTYIAQNGIKVNYSKTLFTMITESNMIRWVKNMEQFHEMMRRKRIEKGLSQYELADLLGVKQPSINHIEKGRRNPSFEVLMGICRILEIPLPWEGPEDET